MNRSLYYFLFLFSLFYSCAPPDNPDQEDLASNLNIQLEIQDGENSEDDGSHLSSTSFNRSAFNSNENFQLQISLINQSNDKEEYYSLFSNDSKKLSLPRAIYYVSAKLIRQNGEEYFADTQYLDASQGFSTSLYLFFKKASEAVQFSTPSGNINPNQEISLTISDPALSVFYTKDGTEPDQNSSLYDGTPITFSSIPDGTDVELRLMFLKGEMKFLLSREYTIDYLTLLSPIVNLSSDTFVSIQELIISSQNSDSTIYYSLDGSLPSLVYNNTIDLNKNGIYELRVFDRKSEHHDSPEVSRSITIEVAGTVVAMKHSTDDNFISLNSGDLVPMNTTVQLSVDLSGQSIHYNINNNTEVNSSDTSYSSPMLFNSAGYQTIQAVSYSASYDHSIPYNVRFGVFEDTSSLIGASTGETNAFSNAMDSQGNIYIVGTTNRAVDGETLNGNLDVYLSKFDSLGNKVWTRLSGTTGGTVQEVPTVKVDANDYIYVVGGYNQDLDGQSKTGTSDGFIIKYNTAGTKISTMLLGVASSETYISDIIFVESGDIYLTGSTSGNLNGESLTENHAVFVARYEPDFSHVWTKLFPVTNGVYWEPIVRMDQGGNIFAAGTVKWFPTGSGGLVDGYILKLNQNGDEIWREVFGVSGGYFTSIFSMEIDSQGNVVIAGHTNGNLHGINNASSGFDGFVSKWDTDGNRLWFSYTGGSRRTDALALKINSSDEIIVVGHTMEGLNGQPSVSTGTTYEWDSFMMRFDSAGNPLSTLVFGGADYSYVYDVLIRELPNGQNVYYFTGYAEGAFDGISALGGDESIFFKAIID